MLKQSYPWIVLLVIPVILTLCSCKTETVVTSTIRDFNTLDLLIELSDMPVGWQVKDEPQFFREIGTVEAATVSFVSNANVTRNGSFFSAFNYGSTQEASRVFNKMFVPRVLGTPPTEWISPVVSAQQAEMGCYDYEGREPFVCQWTAQYEEFVVSFHTWLIPDYMSLSDLEKIVIAIDNKMKSYLGE